MTNSDSHALTRPPPPYSHSELLTRVTALCNELDQLRILHDFYFMAAESLRNGDNDDESEQATHVKLPVFSTWLKEREMAAIEMLYSLNLEE